MDNMSTRERAVIDEQIDAGTAAISLIMIMSGGAGVDWHAFLTEYTRQLFADLDSMREDAAWDEKARRDADEASEDAYDEYVNATQDGEFPV